MPVTIVSGTAGALERALAEAIADAKNDQPLAPVTVLVGHVLLKQHLPRTVAEHGHGFLNVRFVTPDELASLIAPAGWPPPLPAAVRRFAVRRVAQAAAGYFAPVAGRDGFTRALRQLFRELEMGFPSADDVAGALSAIATDADNAKLAELARLFREYASLTSAFSASGAMQRAVDASRLDGPLLVFGLWSRVPEATLLLLERLAAARDVLVFLPAGDEPAVAGVRTRLDQAVVSHRRLDDGSPLLPADTALVSAPDTVREVWEAARACLAWADEGIPFFEMAVVYRSSDPYRALVDEIFAEAGIETYVHEGRPLAQHPLGRRLLALLDLITDKRFTRQRVTDFLAETTLPAATRQAFNIASTAEWDVFSRKAGISGGIEQWRERLDRYAAEVDDRSRADDYAWLQAHVERIRSLRAFIDALHADIMRRPETATWADHLAYVRELAARYAEGLEPVIAALDDLRALSTIAPRVSFADFCAAVADDLAFRDVSSIFDAPARSFGRRGVAVLDASSARHLRFRAVWLLGVAERAWPPPPRPDPLLLEDEREAINRTQRGVLPLRTTPDDEQLTFLLAMQSARERLAVSYARAESGSPGRHLPSYFFRRIAEMLAGRPLNLDELDSSPLIRRVEAGRLAPEDCNVALTHAEYDRAIIRKQLDGQAPAAVAALAADTPAFGRALAARAGRWGNVHSPYDGVFTGDAAIAALPPFGSHDPVSASRMETYATCPHRYFLKHVLHIEPVDEPETIERIDALQRGSMIHEILDRFLRELAAANERPGVGERARHVTRLLTIAQEVGSAREARGVTGRPLVWALDQAQIHDDLLRWYDDEAAELRASGFIPADFEVAFGMGTPGFGDEAGRFSRPEPLPIDVGVRRLLLHGRIDRIDRHTAATRFRVLDYKTGKVRESKPFAGGKALQLPLYLLAASTLVGLPAAAGTAQYYFATTRGAFKRIEFTGAELEVRSEELASIIATIADGAEHGFFAQNPGRGREHCRFCDFRMACEQGVERIAARKASDPRGEAYRAMASDP
jgi:hypothetical protein